MNVLRAAIRARIPLVAVTTDDPINALEVIQHVAKPLAIFDTWSLPNEPATYRSYVTSDLRGVLYRHSYEGFDVDWPTLYQLMKAKNAQLIVVNPPPDPVFMNVGVLQVPESMLDAFIAARCDEDEDHDEIKAALRGLSYKDVQEVSALAMANYNAFSAAALLRVRRERIVLASGLQLVNTEQLFYAPDAELKQWLATEGRLFKPSVARVLRPRGLLFTGRSGTGKTSGAKYIAHELKLPLYMLAFAGLLNKYVGESEKNLYAAFQQLSALAPCVLLFDEVEKLFATDRDDSGGVSRVLSMLLWWLQEHNDSILTLMTANNVDIIPQELIRPGRLDQVIKFGPLSGRHFAPFRAALLDALTVELGKPKFTRVVVDKIKQIKDIYDDSKTQAQLTQEVMALVKVEMLKTMVEG